MSYVLPCFVKYSFKYLEGQNLEQYLQKHPQLDEKEFLRIFLQVCDAIAFAHARGIAHRDLKPENISVSGYGETLVLDWGLACRFKSSGIGSSGDLMEELTAVAQTLDGTIKGTLAYMAPEQAAGQARGLEAAGDIYSLGALMLRYWNGQRPFAGLQGQSLLGQ